MEFYLYLFISLCYASLYAIRIIGSGGLGGPGGFGGFGPGGSGFGPGGGFRPGFGGGIITPSKRNWQHFYFSLTFILSLLINIYAILMHALIK